MLVALFSTADANFDAQLVTALSPHVSVRLHNASGTAAASEGQELVAGLPRFESALLAERPGAVLVRGAGPSALAAALAAAKLDLPIGRLEAGEELAGGGKPGEVPPLEAAYGRLIDRLASARFCSTETQAGALREAGLGDHAVVAGVEAEGLVSAIAAWLGEL